MRGLLRWFGAHRRRLAPFVLVAAVIVIAIQAQQTVPRETHVRLRLSNPSSIREVTLTYEAEANGDTTGTRWAFPEGAPERLNDTPSLSPGRYALQIDVLRVGGRQTPQSRSLQIPADGTILVDLSNEGRE